MTHEDALAYRPPTGIDVNFMGWEKEDVVVVEFVGTDLHPNELYKKTVGEIRHEVQTAFRNRLISDNLGTYHQASPRVMQVHAILEHPLVSGPGVSREIKRAAEAATDVHEIEMTRDEVREMKQNLPHPKYQADYLEPKEIRHRKRRFMDRTPEGKEIVREEPAEDVSVFTSGLIDSG